MKKFLAFFVLTAALSSLWAEKPRRYFEVGVDVRVDAANNWLKLTDFFNEARTMVIDLEQMPKTGFWITANVAANAFMNINFGEKFGLGVFAGVETSYFSSASSDFFKSLAGGGVTMEEASAIGSAGGSTFVDTGISTRFKFGKLSLELAPAVYVPVLYLPSTDFAYRLDTSNGIEVDVAVDVDLHLPIPFDDFIESDSSSGPSAARNGLPYPYSNIDIWQMLDSRGFDFSLNAEYALTPRWDLGLSLTHVPLYPAVLRYGVDYQIDYSMALTTDSLEDIMNGNFSLDADGTAEGGPYDNRPFRAFRPLRIDFYTQFRPLGTNLIVLKPNIGLSALTIYGYDKACFNAGLEAELNLKRIFTLSLATGYRERMWRHNLGLVLNLRVLQVDIGVALESQDFAASFLLEGAGVFLGLRFGF